MTEMVHGMRRVAGWAALAVAVGLAGCVAPPASAPARCATKVVQLLDPVPLFTGPQADAALYRGLPKGQRLQLCGAQGPRQQPLLPRAGPRCAGPQGCASGGILRSARTGATP